MPTQLFPNLGFQIAKPYTSDTCCHSMTHAFEGLPNVHCTLINLHGAY